MNHQQGLPTPSSRRSISLIKIALVALLTVLAASSFFAAGPFLFTPLVLPSANVGDRDHLQSHTNLNARSSAIHGDVEHVGTSYLHGTESAKGLGFQNTSRTKIAEGRDSIRNTSWTVGMLSRARSYFRRISTRGRISKERILMIETAERCTRVLRDRYLYRNVKGDPTRSSKTDFASLVHERLLRFTTRHPICSDLIKRYKNLVGAREQSPSIPPLLLEDLATSEGYCSAMRSHVWRSLIPSLPISLQKALIRQYIRQARAAGPTKLTAGESVFPFTQAFPTALHSFISEEVEKQSRENEEHKRAGERVGKGGVQRQRYLVWSLSGGLGNRFQSLASTLLAAMLSNRVLLVKDLFTTLPPNTKGAKPIIYPSSRTHEYVLEPLANRLFNTRDDALFDSEPKDAEDGSQGHRSTGGHSGIVDFLLSMPVDEGTAVWSINAIDGNVTSTEGPEAQTDWNRSEEHLRPPNSMLLCGIFPLMSLSEFRQQRPDLFAASPVRGPSHVPDAASTADREGGRCKSAVGAEGSSRRAISLAQCPPAPFREDHVKISIAARHDKRLVRWNRFACSRDLGKDSSEDRLESRVSDGRGSVETLFFDERFVYVWTNQYYAPLFYSNPHTRTKMLRWFPGTKRKLSVAGENSDGGEYEDDATYRPEGLYNVLSKLLVIPSSHVMRRVIGFLDGTDKSDRDDREASRLVEGTYISLQVRAFSTSSFGALSEGFDVCLRAIQANMGAMEVGGRSANVPPFFLASLHSQVRDYFISRYGANKVISLAPPAHEQGTGKHYALDLDALADMFLLSLSSVVLVSPGSTFGSFVAAFADMNPIRVDYHRSGVAEAMQRGPNPEKEADAESQHSLSGQIAQALRDLPMCRVAMTQQPCFGSWFRYDKLWHRRGELKCSLQPMPNHGHRCEV